MASTIFVGVGLVMPVIEHCVEKCRDALVNALYHRMTFPTTQNPDAVQAILRYIKESNPSMNNMVLKTCNGQNTYEPGYGKYNIDTPCGPVSVEYTKDMFTFYMLAYDVAQLWEDPNPEARKIEASLPTRVLSMVLTMQIPDFVLCYGASGKDDFWRFFKGVPYSHTPVSRMTSDTHAMMHEIGRFKASGQIYKRRGQVHKAAYLLHGPTRTGKSTIPLLVAETYKMPLYEIHVGWDDMTDGRFRSLMLSIPENSVILIDEIDKGFARLKEMEKKPLDIGTILSTLRGAIPLATGTILFMTANNISFLDDPLYAPLVGEGRVDKLVEFKTQYPVAGLSTSKGKSMAAAAATPSAPGTSTASKVAR